MEWSYLVGFLKRGGELTACNSSEALVRHEGEASMPPKPWLGENSYQRPCTARKATKGIGSGQGEAKNGCDMW